MHTPSYLLGLLLLAGTSTPGQQQEPTPAQDEQRERDPALDPSAFQARIALLQAIPTEERSQDQANELLRLEGGLRALEQAEVEWAKAAEFEVAAEDAPEEIEDLNAKLALPIEDVLPEIPGDVTLEALTSALQNARAELASEQRDLQDLERQISDRAGRRQELLRLIPATTEELHSLDEALAAAADTAQDRSVDDAIRLNRLARREGAQARLARLDAENQGFATLTELLRVQRDHAQREATIAQRVVDEIQGRVDQMREAEAEQARREAEAELQKGADAHPLVLELLEENTELSSENQRITLRLGTLAEELRLDKERLDLWRTQLQQLTAQEARFGLSEAVGMRLRTQQAELPDLGIVRNKIASLGDELARANERYFELSGYSDPESELDRRLRKLGPEERALVAPAAREAWARGEELRTRLRVTYEELLDDLVLAFESRGAFASLVREYGDFIQERIFWIRSTSPLDLDEPARIIPAVERLLDPERWGQLLGHSLRTIRGRPLVFALTLALGITLVTLRRRVIRWLLESGKRVRWSYKGHIGTTLRALLATAGVALAIPSLLWLVALWIGDPDDPQRFGLCVAAALSEAAIVLFALSLLSQACRPAGLGEIHFRWRADTCAFVRSQLRWFTPAIVPLAFLAKLSWQRAGITHDDSLARVVGLLGLILFAVFLHRMFRPRSGLFRHQIEAHPEGWLNRTRNLWYPAAVLTPIGLAITAALGYTYTASQIISRLGLMMLLAIAFTIGYGILLRALFLGERRLAIEKYKGKASGDKSETLGKGDALDVAKLSSQARAIVRLIMIVVVTGSLLVLWVDVLPVLGQLQRVELLSIGTESLPNGESIEIFLTLADVLASALIFIVTFLISRNLTGTLELVLLRRLPLSPGARYATESLAKYLVVIVGVVAGFDRLGIGWSKVQFLAAAITVGLGFGLQEIFANFVSGLIILFERPIRVGDTVTIGQITGEVTRIRMRATTITDWDRKELIIPNREFVTGQVINWTLSDAVMRARVKVGIAYGSDTAKAREILERVGRENPRVLRSPQLDVRFRAFGDSSLDFELRVYVREIEDYIPVMDELHDAIDQAFRASGIEIAFPQRDLHIRSAEAPIEIKDHAQRSTRRQRIEELPDPTSM